MQRSSSRAKAQPLDQWKKDHLDGPYEHLLGFSADEGSRIMKDATYSVPGRTARFPLAEWGWGRAEALGHLHEVFGTDWPRSCCAYCPFGLSDPVGLAARWRDEPDGAVLALLMEQRALVLNPRSTLFGRTSARQFALTHGLHEILAAAERTVRQEPWAIYDVRRIFHPARDKATQQPLPGKKGAAWRSVTTLTVSERDHIDRELDLLARTHRAVPRTDDHGIRRVHLHIPDRTRYPAVERFFAAGPAGVHDKQRPGFETRWHRYTSDVVFSSAA